LIEVATTISAFYHTVINDLPRPKYTYKIIKSNTTAAITMNCDDEYPPEYVTMWQATTLSSTYRDFRLLRCAKIPECIQLVIWFPTVLTADPIDSCQYHVEVDKPKSGWTGFEIELTYKVQGDRTLKLSTEVNIVPDRMVNPLSLLFSLNNY